MAIRVSIWLLPRNVRVSGYYRGGPKNLKPGYQCSQPDHILHECVRRPTHTQRIQGYNARGTDLGFIDVSLIPHLIWIADRLFSKTTQVDQIVTSEAASVGSQSPHD